MGLASEQGAAGLETWLSEEGAWVCQPRTHAPCAAAVNLNPLVASRVPNLYPALPCAQVPATGQDALYITGRTSTVAGTPMQLLLELRFSCGMPGVDASFKAARPELAGMAFDALQHALA